MKRMLWIALILLALSILLCSAALADDSGSCGEDATWTFHSATGEMTVTGTGAMTDYANVSNVPWYNFRDSITSAVIENGVTSIGSFAFDGCAGLTSVTIPSSVTSIGRFAFESCTGLTSVTIPNSVTSIGNSAFQYCAGLTSVTIPGSVTSIGNYAFNSCGSLTSITIPNSVTSMGAGVFLSCTGLTSVIIPSSVTFIGYSAFYNCSSLTSVAVLNRDCTIGDSDYDVFKGCASGFKLRGWLGSTAEAYAGNTQNPCGFEPLGGISGSCGENVTWAFIPAIGMLTISGTGAMTDYATVNDVPWYIYRDSITSAVIENGVTSIGMAVFSNCVSLTAVTIPSSVTSIGNVAFRNTGLTSVTIPSSVTSIGVGVFMNSANLTSVTIPNSVTSISEMAFTSTGLTSVTIPSSVTGIGADAFRSCTGLTSVTIPDGVTSIGATVFKNCTGLTSVIIPGSVTSIGNSAFWGCTGLTSVTILNPYCAVGDDDYDVFYDCASGFTLRGWADSTAEAYAGNTTNPCAFEALRLSGSCGENVTWAFNIATDVLTITGTGAMTDYAIESNVPWFSFRDNITSVVVENGVTSIGNYAFKNCTDLITVTIPSSVTQIGKEAFSGSGLISAFILNPDCQIGDSKYDVFLGCDGAFNLFGYSGSTAEVYAANTINPCSFDLLAPAPDFFLPAALTSVEGEAFLGISAKAVVIPKDIQSISGNPFAGSSVQYIYGFPGTAAETLAQNYPTQFTFLPFTDAWYTRLTD